MRRSCPWTTDSARSSRARGRISVGPASVLALFPVRRLGSVEVLDYRLDDEHEALRETVERFAREVVAPLAAEYDESE
ncbi:MAG: acyl-CoA dehydrogenase family protein, partial [Streptosporangiaceae bacterium]